MKRFHRRRWWAPLVGLYCTAGIQACSKSDAPSSAPGSGESVATASQPASTASVKEPSNHGASATGSSSGATGCDACASKNCPDPLKAIAARCKEGACDGLLACVKRSRCDKKAMDTAARRTGIDLRYCYCGDDVEEANLGECFLSDGKDAKAPHGACKAEIEKVAGATKPIDVGTNFFNMDTPLGAVAQTESCENALCYSQCF